MASTAEPLTTPAEAFFDASAHFTTVVGTRSDNDMRYLVSSRDRGVGRSLMVDGARSEMSVLARVLKLLQSTTGLGLGRRHTFLDVGANIGTTTIAALKRGGFLGAVAAEPAMENYGLLRANLALNGLLGRATTLPVAISDEDGTVPFALSLSNSGAHYVATGLSDARQEKLRLAERIGVVERRSIASLVAAGALDPELIDLAWVDTQGHEGNVLAGAQPLVERGVPMVLEFHPQMLGRAGGFELFRAVAREHYTHVVDVRAIGARREASLRPVATLDDIAARLLDDDFAGRFTDVLLVRKRSRDG